MRRILPVWGLCALLSILACAHSDRTDPVDAGLLARAQEHIAAREYRASENEHGLQAPNRAHDLRTYFEKTGVRVHDRTAGGSPELLRLSLAGVGRGEALAPAGPGTEVVSTGNRIEIRRPGVTEWYVNSPAGLEQGFTLSDRPPGDGSLVLEIATAGARASLRDGAVTFETAGRTLRYGELAVVDANASRVAARFAVASADRLRIVVDDADATYPLVIDPLLTGIPDTYLVSDQQDAGFGRSVASAGDVNGDGLGDLIVGAVVYDAGQTNEGAAFVFLGSVSGVANAFAPSAAAQLEANQTLSYLGAEVASAGDVNGDGYGDVIVSAHGYDAGQTDEGAAFIFLGSASGIADGNPATAATRLESDQASASLWHVASAGDVNGDGYGDVIVSSSWYDAGQSDEGAAFVFHGSASGIANGNPATADARIQSNQADARLGRSIATAGDVNADGYDDVIVGALFYDEGQADEGAAFVFHGSPFGIFDRDPTSAEITLESNQTLSYFGSSVASAGNVNGDFWGDVIVGADHYATGLDPHTDEGVAFVFHGRPSNVWAASPATADARLESDQVVSEFGASVASAGDVNADGYGDVIVGAPGYAAGETNEGAAFVFLGGVFGVADATPAGAAAQLEPDVVEAQFGSSVASAGDVNGDGYGDVIVGAPVYSLGPGPTAEGAAFVYLPEPMVLLGLASGVALLAALRRTLRERR